MKKLYRSLALGLAILSIVCLFNDLELVSMPGFILFGFSLYWSEKYE